MQTNKRMQIKGCINRRTFIAVSGATIAGALTGCLSNGGTVLATSVDTISIHGEETTLEGDPSEINLDVSGSWTLQTTLESATQLRVECLVDYNNTAESMDTDVSFDPVDGDSSSWSINCNVLEHGEINPELFNNGAGTTSEEEITVIIAFQLISQNGVHSETSEHINVPLTVHQDGHSHSIESNGEGEITIS